MSGAFPFAMRREVLLGLLATGSALGSAGTGWAKTAGLSDYDLARELYRYAFPLIFFGRFRHQLLTDGDPQTGQRLIINQWLHANRAATPESTGAPQTDTLYSLLLGDLSKGPLLLTIPRMDGRYWSIQGCDFFGVTFAMVNRRNTDGPATVALVGPNWRGQLPDHVTASYVSPMPQVIALMRSHFVSDADREKVVALRAGVTAVPPSGQNVAASGIVPIARGKDPLADFKLLAAMWRDCPPPKADRALLGRFARLGFGPGAKPDVVALSPDRQAVLARAEADGLAEVLASVRKGAARLTANGWGQPNPELGLYRDKDYLFRAMIAQQGVIGTPISENVYMNLHRMPDGSLLDGSSRYELTIDPSNLTEAQAFWSLHAYRLPAFRLIPNSLNRYSIGGRSPGLRYNPDGSPTIFVQNSDPGRERSSNWLPVAAGENFALITRAYEPTGAIARLEWPGPRVVKTG